MFYFRKENSVGERNEKLLLTRCQTRRSIDHRPPVFITSLQYTPKSTHWSTIFWEFTSGKSRSSFRQSLCVYQNLNVFFLSSGNQNESKCTYHLIFTPFKHTLSLVNNFTSALGNFFKLAM